MFISYSTIIRKTHKVDKDFSREPFSLVVSKGAVWCKPNKEI